MLFYPGFFSSSENLKS